MATIYRFIIEQKQSTGGAGRQPRGTTSKKTTAKKGRVISTFTSDRGGVEHNRKMRAINPLLNRVTGGWWEKGMRAGRATIGLGKSIKQNGAKGVLTGPAIYIIVALILTTLMKWQSTIKVKEEKANAQNFKRLENGQGGIYGAYQYKIDQNFWTGRITYNQNK